MTHKFVYPLLLLVAVGCTNSTPTGNPTSPQPVVEQLPIVDASSQPAVEDAGSTPEPVTTESATGELIESAVLKSAMIEATVAAIAQRQPDADADAIRQRAESMIAQIREDAPEFLMVSAETEQKLQAGESVASSATRIAEGEAFLRDFQVQVGGLVSTLLPEHHAGNLDPVHTELLAHLIAADVQKTRDALSN